MFRCLRLRLSLLYESLRRKLRLTVYRRLQVITVTGTSAEICMRADSENLHQTSRCFFHVFHVLIRRGKYFSNSLDHLASFHIVRVAIDFAPAEKRWRQKSSTLTVNVEKIKKISEFDAEA